MTFTLPCSSTCAREAQRAKASRPISVTLAGMTMASSTVQSRKQPLSSRVRPLPRVTLSRDVQPAKASSSMTATVSGRVMRRSCVWSAKAEGPMPITARPLTMGGTTTVEGQPLTPETMISTMSLRPNISGLAAPFTCSMVAPATRFCFSGSGSTVGRRVGSKALLQPTTGQVTIRPEVPWGKKVLPQRWQRICWTRAVGRIFIWDIPPVKAVA